MRDAFLKLGTRQMVEIDHEFDKRNLRTEDRVSLLKGFLKGLAEHLVPDHMAVVIVDQLEAI